MIILIFQDWDGKKIYKASDVPYFYEDFDDFSASMLQILDDEIQAIKAAINVRYPNFDLSMVLPIK